MCSPSAFYPMGLFFCVLLLCTPAAAPALCIPPWAEVGPVHGADTGGAASWASVTTAGSATMTAGVHKVLIGIAHERFKWIWNSVWNRGAVTQGFWRGQSYFKPYPSLLCRQDSRVFVFAFSSYLSGMSLLNDKVALTFPSPLFAPVLFFLYSSADFIWHVWASPAALLSLPRPCWMWRNRFPWQKSCAMGLAVWPHAQVYPGRMSCVTGLFRLLWSLVMLGLRFLLFFCLTLQ